ncbi:nickel-dependent lactate racemase [Candidatus Bathyarchaeota archaeon]|nr:nickel-dependent lactate racemase [Candidatus Bathyarchaeota archaeon]
MSYRKIIVPYQDQIFEAEIESHKLLAVVNNKLDLPPIDNLEVEARSALLHTIGSKPISKRVSFHSKVAILVDDYTRPTPAQRLAPLIIEELIAAGVKERNVFFVYATGQHPANIELAKEKIGKDLADRFEIVVHNPKAFDDLVFLGFTSSGTPVWVNKAIERANFIIGIGGIRPNFSPGWSGGCKIVMPGISGWETINFTHTKVMAGDKVTSEGVEDTPVRRDIEEIGDMAGLDFILNVVWNRSGQICGVVAGDPHKAWQKGLEISKKSFVYRLPRRAEIVVLGSGQTEYISEAIITAMKGYNITTENGTIIVVAPCTKGWGKEEIPALEKNWYKSFPSEELMQLTASEIVWKAQKREFDPVRNMNVPYGMKLTIEKRHVIIVSHVVSPEKLRKYGVDHAVNLEEALRKAYIKQGEDAQTIVVPDNFRYIFKVD